MKQNNCYVSFMCCGEEINCAFFQPLKENTKRCQDLYKDKELDGSVSYECLNKIAKIAALSLMSNLLTKD